MTTATTSSSSPSSKPQPITARLRAAQNLSSRRRLRVSFAMGQAGWMALLVGMTPFFMFFMGNPVHFAVGDFTWWQVLAALGCNLLLLALFPTDARAIRAVCSAFFSGFCGVAVALIAWQVKESPGLAVIIASAALCFALAATLFPTLPCRGARAMQPRRALQRLWALARSISFILGVCNVGIVAARLATATSFVHFTCMPHRLQTLG